MTVRISLSVKTYGENCRKTHKDAISIIDIGKIIAISTLEGFTHTYKKDDVIDIYTEVV